MELRMKAWLNSIFYIQESLSVSTNMLLGFSDMHAWKKFQTQNFNISTSINTLTKLVDLGILKLWPSYWCQKGFKFLPGTSNTARHILPKNHIMLLSTTPRTIKDYLFYSFSWINMQTKTEDVYVTKFVGLLTRILKHLDLYFFDFSTNF